MTVVVVMAVVFVVVSVVFVVVVVVVVVVARVRQQISASMHVWPNIWTQSPEATCRFQKMWRS